MIPVASAGEDSKTAFEEDIPVKCDLTRNGVCLINGSDFQNRINGTHSREEICRFWDDLVQDQFMGDNGQYRMRRFGRFTCNGKNGTPEYKENENSFFQSRELNPLNGGFHRKFAPITPENKTLLGPNAEQVVFQFGASKSPTRD